LALAALREAAARGRPFDFVLLDVMMPGADGFSVAAQIREDSIIAGVPIMMLSSMDLTDHAGRCQALGIATSVMKPIRRSDLFRALTAHLARSGEHPISPPPAATVPAAGARALRVLLAEDNVVNRKVARSFLERRGHQVSEAHTGAEALRLLESGAFDVVLMDVQMPEMDGLEATRRLRARERDQGAARMPVIALTAFAMAGDRERCLDAGVDDYLTKPIIATRLYEVLDAAMPGSPAGTACPVRARAAGLNRSAILAMLGGDTTLLQEITGLVREDAPVLLAKIHV